MILSSNPGHAVSGSRDVHCQTTTCRAVATIKEARESLQRAERSRYARTVPCRHWYVRFSSLTGQSAKKARGAHRARHAHTLPGRRHARALPNRHSRHPSSGIHLRLGNSRMDSAYKMCGMTAEAGLASSAHGTLGMDSADERPRSRLTSVTRNDGGKAAGGWSCTPVSKEGARGASAVMPAQAGIQSMACNARMDFPGRAVFSNQAASNVKRWRPALV